MLARALPPIVALLPLLFGASQALDSEHATELTRIAFGSCSKQYKDQPLWTPLTAFDPQLFLWTGDVVYVPPAAETDTEVLAAALRNQSANPAYVAFLRATNVSVEGVYDDHDMGVNDGGNHVSDIFQRSRMYLDFLRVDKSHPRWQRPGLYSSHTWGVGERKVKVVLLDTRSFRELPVQPLRRVVDWLEADTRRAKALSLFLPIVRWLAVVLRRNVDFDGSLLGEEQWAWLERELDRSDAAAHLVVSSIQVLGSIPMLEGWGHFPREQARLLALLERHRPRGLVLISGDVHFAELLATTDQDGGHPLEVTSSGMTHTCEEAIWGLFCPFQLDRRARHRLRPEAYYIGLNYGTVEIEWAAEGSPPGGAAGNMTVAVRDAEGAPVLTWTQALPSASSPPPFRRLGAPASMQQYGLWADRELLAVIAGVLGGIVAAVVLALRLVVGLFRGTAIRHGKKKQS